MFQNLVEKLSCILKEQKTRDFAKESVENIAKFFLAKDGESGAKQVVETAQYVSGIKDILFWSKMKKWLENTYQSPDMEVKIASKFSEDEPKYKEYTKRQLQFIAQVDEEEKIDFYSNLTRAWLLGYIATSLYFKLAYLLKIFTLEELDYLKQNYSTAEISEINYYIREFSLYGLIDVVETTNLGNSVYRYSQLAGIFLDVGLYFNDERKIKYSNLGLSDLKVENTKTCMEITEF